MQHLHTLSPCRLPLHELTLALGVSQQHLGQSGAGSGHDQVATGDV